MVFLGQFFRQRMADFAVTHNNDPHENTSSIHSLQTKAFYSITKQSKREQKRLIFPEKSRIVRFLPPSGRKSGLFRRKTQTESMCFFEQKEVII